MKKKNLAIIPTYNELKNIPSLLKQLFSLEQELSVLIVDDNSPDRTSEQVEKLQRRFSRLFLIKRRCRMGIGSAYIEGFNYALKHGYDVVIQMDADLFHDFQCIPKMINLLSDCNLILGS